jgi:FAD/FMN-containing dehydrogenase
MASIAGLETLAKSFTGRLLQPQDPGYDDARSLHNGLIDKRPAVIACCRGTADVSSAVTLAREAGLEVAVRGGGHNVAGKSTIDGGLMIDLAPMKGIHVDPEGRTARAQGGVLWRELNRETQLHGLAVTGGVVSTTGIAGLTLGGGIGWLMPKYGLALDNLRSVEMVMADGRVQRVNADESPDLFWGVRGGGGNFGIASSFEYDVHAVGPVITGGLVAHPLARAREVLTLFRDQALQATDHWMLAAGLLTGPDGATKLVGVLGAHSGTLPDGEAALKPIKTFGSPVMDVMGPIPYSEQNSLLDASLPRGAFNYWKSQFLAGLTDDCIRTLVECYERCPSPMGQIVIEDVHGAGTRIPVTATACTFRVAGFNVVIISQWKDPSETDRCIAWCRETYSALKPFLAPTRYVNYLAADEDVVVEAYGPNYERLRDLKTTYDPDNLFHHNVNIPPR